MAGVTQHPQTHHPVFPFGGHPVGRTPILELLRRLS